ncbi:uncharacterized protein DUF2567 [Saccharopolyspora erythraea NRRL 2338]|uniref:Uncharacterized protein n=2 Tax=Saccharopolyspora erythraea TaxID=1836 RepID=A4FLR8_SACEN|nr:DUF2567 domain-containing protein [Saccharopolyspora erythraea]EQD88154.1 hypothetical protein N599_00105 [Saccharopolyspora erythraea D]PFG98630.1 uncharacterized protein DUF2567 [Saccharopolyspora erythraea NRRL 2338]QRK88660.1 DUF2567 domain-containing protein [Saccharopolyspora erythraea]CAM04993.1 hypothetical protein SACE_5809 [Saccharopolyspora erythraea NRRL 2338]
MPAEGPVESPGTRAEPMRIAPSGPEELSEFGYPQPVPRVVVRADILPAVSVLSLVALVGLPLGWLWSRLAPPQASVLEATGEPAPLMVVESYHRFDALALFLLLNFGTGLLVGAALWMLRGRRGPVVLVGAVLGALVAGWLAMKMGASFAAGLHPLPPQPRPGDVVDAAPEVATAWAVVAQPMAIALAYGLAASWNGLDDLGRRLR